MEKLKDGSIINKKVTKMHPKQQDSLLQATKMNSGEVETLVKVIDNYIE